MDDFQHNPLLVPFNELTEIRALAKMRVRLLAEEFASEANEVNVDELYLDCLAWVRETCTK